MPELSYCKKMPGLRIGIIDSGINPAHPHVQGAPVSGARIGLYQNTSGDMLDYLGHGTAVAGAIRSHCAEAELFIAKVFDKTLQTRTEVILRAIAWCTEQQVQIINLSLGTHNAAHSAAFEEWASKVTLISAAGALPGGLKGVVTVSEDPELQRDEWKRTGDLTFLASGRPRPIPGRSEEENLGGVSFAVANFTGLAARQWLLTRQLPWEPDSQWSGC
jgi:subtilisin family serine protease